MTWIAGTSPTESADLPERITQGELAEYWRVSTRTLERWRAHGAGPAWMKLEGRVLYRRDDVAAYEEAQTRDTEASQ